MITDNWVNTPNDARTAVLATHYRALFRQVTELSQLIAVAMQAKSEVPSDHTGDHGLRLQRSRTFEVALLRVHHAALNVNEGTALLYCAIMATLGVKDSDDKKDLRLSVALNRFSGGPTPHIDMAAMNNITASLELFHEACRLSLKAHSIRTAGAFDWRGIKAAAEGAKKLHVYQTKMVAQVPVSVTEMEPTGPGATLLQANEECVTFESDWGHYGGSACIHDPRSGQDMDISPLLPQSTVFRCYPIGTGSTLTLDLYAEYKNAYVHDGCLCVTQVVGLEKNAATFFIQSYKEDGDGPRELIGVFAGANSEPLYVYGAKSRGQKRTD